MTDAATLVDLALTWPGKGRGESGRMSEQTMCEYAKIMATSAEPWYRQAGRSLMPWTPEDLAEYAAHLIDAGKAVRTVGKCLSAVKAWHRAHGHPVPDGTPAWHVLCGHQHSREPACRQPATREQVEAMADACAAETVRGARDRCLIVVTWHLLTRASIAVTMDIEDVVFPGGRLSPTPERVAVTVVGERFVLLPDLDTPVMCPVRALAGWVRHLADAGATDGPLYRSVDRLGRIAGTGQPFCGESTASGRMPVEGAWRIWKRRATEAGVPVRAHTTRTGGARAALAAGESATSVLDRGGWNVGRTTAIHPVLVVRDEPS